MLINEYKMKSLYIFGSYYLKTNRFDSDIDLYVIFSLDVPFIEKEKLVKEVKDVLFNHFRRFIDIEEIFKTPSHGYKVF
ncbi:MAG: nucleotidyltransferase domain-containing protein [Candidatus Onthovivens sp.]|nr:nucleotidyltransferase domain-containing protein [Candidatus Onthovivens sp.]MDY3994130.1 nucleotidyltransferase domain-containing protein [Candidatus Onthovivens sp.]MDY4822765.1 nucleotidyltransferase domain-containing protein [Candidatus Onthovivens sp.]MDY5646529.1 nucleotidyltransferase domain-containing protein [Candidatus Onthovivens sp.]MDY5892242.1 nucleotidyltransferase domain-containing protein [Candidatus Onthovivens sp.]